MTAFLETISYLWVEALLYSGSEQHVHAYSTLQYSRLYFWSSLVGHFAYLIDFHQTEWIFSWHILWDTIYQTWDNQDIEDCRRVGGKKGFVLLNRQDFRSGYSSLLASILSFLAGGPEGTSESFCSDKAEEAVVEDEEPEDPPAEARSLAAEGSIITSLTEKSEGLNLTITAVMLSQPVPSPWVSGAKQCSNN